jgi:hypothetical protein
MWHRNVVVVVGDGAGMSRVARGRWVILFDDETPPAFWSTDRDMLERLCQQLRGPFPSARVVWEPSSTPSDTVPPSDEPEEK